MIGLEETDMWYSARLLYESVHEDREEALFEEKIVVFKCADRDQVLVRLGTIAAENEVSYDNVFGNRVDWTFREVLEVQELFGEDITEGTEVFFRFWTNPDSRDFENMRRTHEEPWWEASTKATPTNARDARALRKLPRLEPASPLGLERRNLILLLKREVDVVKAVDQAVTAKLMRRRIVVNHKRSAKPTVVA